MKKEQSGRKSLRRLKPTVGCNASKRRRRRRRCPSVFLSLCVSVRLNVSACRGTNLRDIFNCGLLLRMKEIQIWLKSGTSDEDLRACLLLPATINRHSDALFDCNTGCPTGFRTRHFFNNFTTNEDSAMKFEADLPHCVRNVKEKNVLLFKSRCNIFIGVRIIKEMPGLVASGTPCSIRLLH